jgi:acyl carrier protein
MTLEVEQQVIAAIARAKRLSIDEITLESTFEELGVDSLDAIELLFELEETYEIAIPDDEAKSFETVREVVESLNEALAEQASADRGSES